MAAVLALHLPLLTNGIQNVLLGLLVIGLAIPLVKGRIDRNNWYGVRMEKAYRSEADWKVINRHGGWVAIWWSLPVVVLGLGMIIAAVMMPAAGLRDSTWVFPLSLAPLLLIGAYVQVKRWVSRLP